MGAVALTTDPLYMYDLYFPLLWRTLWALRADYALSPDMKPKLAAFEFRIFVFSVAKHESLQP